VNNEHRLIVAGVSSLDSRLAMVRWAADEAAARSAELVLVTAVPPRADPEQYLPSDAADRLRDTARTRLAQAAELAAASRPGLRISTEVISARPVDALLQAATRADVLVVGADDQSPFAEAIAGSVPGTLLTTAPCPLVVVPQAEPVVPDTAPVFVALDEHGFSKSALAYGFAAADRSARRLHILRCVPAGTHKQADVADRARSLIAFGQLYPDVEVTQETAVGDPRDVLADRSRASALLVLGSRGHGRLASTLFGSVSRDLIRRSGCPVVVARPRSAELEGVV